MRRSAPNLPIFQPKFTNHYHPYPIHHGRILGGSKTIKKRSQLRVTISRPLETIPTADMLPQPPGMITLVVGDDGWTLRCDSGEGFLIERSHTCPGIVISVSGLCKPPENSFRMLMCFWACPSIGRILVIEISSDTTLCVFLDLIREPSGRLQSSRNICKLYLHEV